jgi:MFS family permease
MNGPSFQEFSRRTFIYDNARCFFTGILEGGFKGFVLLIAIRAFDAPCICKAIMSSAGFAGLLFAPIMVSLASRLCHTPATKICAAYFMVVACILLASVFTNSFWMYFALVVLARVLFKQYIPLMIDVYGNNYSKEERGYKLAYSLMVLPIATTIFSVIGGIILDFSRDGYRIILLTIAIAAAGAAYSFYRIPSRPIPRQGNGSLLVNFKIIFQDRLFLMMLLLMTLTGIATQMTVPLRAEYLANERCGINSSNLFVMLTITTIPYVCRMVSSIFWGSLFDRISIIRMRVIVNLFLLLGFILFFNSTSIAMLSLSAILTGLGYGGGEVVWCLWVTKITDRDKLSQYMSANTAFVGVRSFVAPFIGYLLFSCGCSFSCIGNIAATLVLISLIGCFLIRNHPRFSKIYD